MSLALINHSADLKQLRDEGYEVEVYKAYLLINNIPYVNASKQVLYGILVSPLELSGDVTTKPNDHTVRWIGEFPCDSNGSQLIHLVNNANLQEKIKDDLVATLSFSHKPEGGYLNYYQKMTRYVQILEGEALAIDKNVTARTFTPVKIEKDESVFCYLDSSSSRAGIVAINEKLKKDKIAIVGLGGTGSYILDLVAKTLVGEIHLFDGDKFLQHNAFRSPGAPSYDDLKKKPMKVEWFKEIYSRMRRNIIPHTQFIDDTNITELKSMNFVFLCLDKGIPKRMIIAYLIENNIPFIDVGMGLYNENDSLGGSVRVTTVTSTHHNHIENCIPFSDGEDNAYTQNIQIADLNALNAALAVIKWKKIWGFYYDFNKEHHTLYQVSMNLCANEEIQNET